MNLSPELFDRIEIVKGPRSAIYGTDAIGGVVNLITRTGGRFRRRVMLDYGRYGTGEFAADGNYTDGGTSVQAALTGQQTAGFPTYAADTLDSGYKNLSGTAAAHHAPRAIRSSGALLSGDRRHASTPMPSTTPTTRRSSRSAPERATSRTACTRCTQAAMSRTSGIRGSR